MKKCIILFLFCFLLGCNDKHAEKNEFVYNVMNSPDSLFYYMENSSFICSYPSLDWGDERKESFIKVLKNKIKKYFPNGHEVFLVCEGQTHHYRYEFDTTTTNYSIYLTDKKDDKPVFYFNWAKKDTIWILNALSRVIPDKHVIDPECW